MRRYGFLALMLLVPLWAQAGSFQVNPIRVTLSADHSTDVVRVTNSSDTQTVVQLQIVAWSQEDGKDVYVPSRNLLATPPIFTVAPGRQQVIRVGMRSAPDAKRETAYRLYLTEVPPAPTPGFRGVQIALRVGIPVFVEPALATAPSLQWTVKRLSSTEVEISAVNSGTAHVQILQLSLNTPMEKQPLVQESGGYVLPGARHSWTLKLSSPLPVGSPLDINANTDRGTLHAQLVPGK